MCTESSIAAACRPALGALGDSEAGASYRRQQDRAQCGQGSGNPAAASIDVDIDPTLTGFSTGEISVIFSSAADPDDEVVPAVPAKPRTKPGDIWRLSEHRVGCGDSRDVQFLQRVIRDEARVDAAHRGADKEDKVAA